MIWVLGIIGYLLLGITSARVDLATISKGQDCSTSEITFGVLLWPLFWFVFLIMNTGDALKWMVTTPIPGRKVKVALPSVEEIQEENRKREIELGMRGIWCKCNIAHDKDDYDICPSTGKNQSLRLRNEEWSGESIYIPHSRYNDYKESMWKYNNKEDNWWL